MALIVAGGSDLPPIQICNLPLQTFPKDRGIPQVCILIPIFYMTVCSTQFKYNMHNHSTTPAFASLEENLTNSIRRAKEKIYHHSLSTYPLSNQFAQEPEKPQSPMSHQYFEGRNRAASQRVSSQVSSNREQGNALAAAMKNLQDRIATLEREKREMSIKHDSGERLFQRSENEERQKMQRDMNRLVTALREKDQQVKRLNRANSDLISKNTDLLQKVLQLEEALERSNNNAKQRRISQQLSMAPQMDSERGQDSEIQSKYTALLAQKDLKILQLEEQLSQLESRNALSHQTIEKLMRQLQDQKKTNLRWIKLHEEQLKKEPQKQNSSLEANRTDIKPKVRQPQRKDYGQLLRINKETHEALERSKTKIADLTRDVKEAEQRYTKLRLLVCEIVDNVNKIVPHQNTHLKFLINRIQKLENIHLESLRSLSNHSRRSIPRHSNSNDRKKSLKMSDLNSSSKKSQQRSAGKSSRKRKTLEQLSHSEKKPRLISDQQLELQNLERQVAGLRRQHRNLVVRAEKSGNGDAQLNKKIEQTTLLYVQKKNRVEELRRNGCHGVIKRQLLVLE